MGVRILQGDEDDGACLYCSVSMQAFGPLFTDRDQAQTFLDWLGSDARRFSNSELLHQLHKFITREEDAA